MIKRVKSPNYNSVFNTETGFFARWGKTQAEDPTMSPFGPEIADIEISTICKQGCKFCYKSNTETGKNMSLETFSNILSKFPKSLTQIAYGIGTISECPDLFPILEHTRANGVIPNITVNGAEVAGETASKLAKVVGSIAVSHYSDNQCFNAVKELADAGAKQINIHQLLANETLTSCYKLIDSVKTDARLSSLKAIVFLLLKPKGDRNTLTPIKNLDEYRKLMDYALAAGVNIGMDSCSGPMALSVLSEQHHQSVEPCESGLFSIYVDVDGFVYPCSFAPGTTGWETGIDMKTISNFDEIWNHPRIVEFRNGSINSSNGCNSCSAQKSCRSCTLYPVSICKNELVNIEVI